MDYGLSSLGLASSVQLIFVGVFLMLFTGITENEEKLADLLGNNKSRKQRRHLSSKAL
jgi:hypothetical protein